MACMQKAIRSVCLSTDNHIILHACTWKQHSQFNLCTPCGHHQPWVLGANNCFLWHGHRTRVLLHSLCSRCIGATVHQICIMTKAAAYRGYQASVCQDSKQISSGLRDRQQRQGSKLVQTV